VHDLPVKYDPLLLEKIEPRLREKLSAKGFHVTGYRLEVQGECRPPGEHSSATPEGE